MENAIIIYIIWLMFGIMIVSNAARERQGISMVMVILACIFLTPIGGLLYCLCFRHK